ncbi:MAG: methylmalonyl Co-A mutase-associated GTPase MeaB [Thermaerobacter sp.]|nr:methylmalonyl Co-A mutase-associated GTPase MeaB [Thermaerobacter sp.]
MKDWLTVQTGIRNGDKRAVARGLTWVEQGTDNGKRLVKSLFGSAGRAHVIGVTGAPGVGKSTLVNALALHLRQKGRYVGILAVDPSSPFSGGAILGDRIRMQDSVMDPGVFMRSLASRGHLGGLSRATFGAVTVLDAAGFDTILIETVGAGQSEVEIMQLAHTTVVVLAPGLGDDIQAIKAGILEIGQVFVVNKADRDGADHTVRSIRGMLTLATEHPDWMPPILKTVAERGEGVAALRETIDGHRQHLETSGIWHQFRRTQSEHVVGQVLEDWLLRHLNEARGWPQWPGWLAAIAEGRLDPERVAESVWHGAPYEED